MSMYAEKYANAPQSISRLFENDIVSNKCIKAITNYLIFSVVVLFLQIIQIDIGIIMLIVLGVKALKIIVSFAFMSRRTYQFSDMYYVTNAVYKEIYRNLLHLNKGKMFTHDNNFQNHYKKQVKKCGQITEMEREHSCIHMSGDSQNSILRKCAAQGQKHKSV